MKFKYIFVILLLSALIVVVGCGLTPGKSAIAGKAVSLGKSNSCVDEWFYQNSERRLEGPFEGCSTINGERRCAVKTVEKQVYISGNGEGTEWANCENGDDSLCVSGKWHYQQGNGVLEGGSGYVGCITEFADLDANGNPIPWCATKIILRNVYVEGNLEKTIIKSCSAQNNVPLVEQKSCVDTDGGLNYGTFGTVMAPNTEGSAYGDGCFNDNLKEWYCEDGNAKAKEISCPLGSVCDKSKCPSLIYCSGVGSNEFTGASNDLTMQETYVVKYESQGEQTFTDSCEGKELVSYKCSGKGLAQQKVNCVEKLGEKWSCFKGACDYNKFCNPGDKKIECKQKDSGKKLLGKPLLVSSNILLESICDSKGEKFIFSNEKECPSDKICSNGECVISSSVSLVECKGTGFANTLLKQSIVEYYSDGSKKILTDYCKDEDHLVEFTCKSNQERSCSSYMQNSKCIDGACVLN